MTHLTAQVKPQSWLQLLSIQAGGALCLPMIIIGHLLCQKYGWRASLMTIGVGNFLLLLLGLGFAHLGTTRPHNTVKQAIFSFGRRGEKGFALIMMLCVLGWFSVQLNVMSLGICEVLASQDIFLSSTHLNILLGVLLSGVMCFGMKAIEKLANLCAPLLGITLLLALALTDGYLPKSPPLTFSLLGGISMIIGGGIASVIDLPTFFQHARTKKDSYLAVIFLYGAVVPLIEATGVYLSALTGNQSLLRTLQISEGFIGTSSVALFVLFCGWTTNNANLYSAIASSYSIESKSSYRKRTLLLGLLGTVMACLHPLENLEPILKLFGMVLGSMGAIILTNFFLEKELFFKIESTISALVGIAYGMVAFLLSFSFSGIMTLDTFLITVCAQICLTFRKKL